MVIRGLSTSLLMLVVVTPIGCGRSEPAGVTGRGSVTVDGRPLVGAVITLQPIAPTTGPKATAPIFDGKFEIPRSAELHGGTYLVRFTMMPPELRRQLSVESNVRPPPEDAVIRSDFDSDSRLNWEILPDQENSRRFEVKFQ